MRRIKTVTREFGKRYLKVKQEEAKKSELQKEFFEIATAEIAKRSLSTQVIEVPDVDNPSDWIQERYPGWQIVSVQGWESTSPEKGSHYNAIIKEDPALMAFTYLNPADRCVYARTTTQGPPSLDDERLRKEDPDLWERITVWPEPWYSLVVDVYKHLWDEWQDGLEDLAANFLRDRGVQRVLRPIESLSNDELDSLQEYLVPGKVSVRLVPPRPAKRDELEEAGL